MIVLDTTDVVLTASNIPEFDHAQYDSETTYNTGDFVTHNGKNYECVQDNTLDIEPTSDIENWNDLGATNRLKAFDDELNTQSVHDDSITYTFDVPGLVNSIALLNVEAESVLVTVNDPIEGEVYRKTEQLADMGVPDWWEYFFTVYDTHNFFIGLDLPNYAGVTINVTISQPTGTAKCGVVLAGSKRIIGKSEFGFSGGITDFSKKETDEFGRVNLKKRHFADKLNVPISLDTNSQAQARRTLTNLRAKPSLFIVSEHMPENFVYGFYKDFSVVIDNGIKSTCNIEIEGLI